MPATDAEQLIITMSADIRKMQKSLDKATSDVNVAAKKIESRFAQLNKAAANQLGGLGKSLAAGFAGGIGASALGDLPGLFRDIISSAADIQDVADKVGITAEQLQGLQYQAKLAGESTDSLDSALAKFSKNIGDAASGTGDLLKILDANGVALRNSDGSLRSVNSLLESYADLMKNAATPQEALVLATAAFSKGGAGMVNVLRDGSVGMSNMSSEASKLGLILSNEMVDSAAKLDDEFDKLVLQLTGQLKQGFLKLGPAILDADGRVGSLGSSVEKLVNSPSWRNFIEVLAGKSAANALLGQGLGPGPSFENRGRGAPGAPTPTHVPTKADEDAAREAERAANRASAEAARLAKAHSDAIKQVSADLVFEAAQLGRSAQEQEVYNTLKAAGVTIESQTGQGLRDQVELLNARRAAMEADVNAVHLLADAQQDYNDSLKYLGQTGVDSLFDVASGAKSAEDAIRDLTAAIIKAALSAALFGEGPLAGLFGTKSTGGSFGQLFANAKGNAFSNGRVTPFARGGVVTRPTVFPMASGTGLMGEAGPEGVLPLSRINGKLGVNAKGLGGGSETNVFLMNAPPSTRREQDNGKGGKDIFIDFVDGRIAKNNADPMSKGGKALQTMGAFPVPTRR